jgi:hypothetical protein
MDNSFDGCFFFKPTIKNYLSRTTNTMTTCTVLAHSASSKATMSKSNQAHRQEAALNYLTGWFIITQDHICKGGGCSLPRGSLESIIRVTTKAFGLEKLKLKKTIYERTGQQCLILSSSSSLFIIASKTCRQPNNIITGKVSICNEKLPSSAIPSQQSTPGCFSGATTTYVFWDVTCCVGSHIKPTPQDTASTPLNFSQPCSTSTPPADAATFEVNTINWND